MYAVHTTLQTMHTKFSTRLASTQHTTQLSLNACVKWVHIPMLSSTHAHSHSHPNGPLSLFLTYYFVRSQIGFSLPFVHWNAEDFWCVCVCFFLLFFSSLFSAFGMMAWIVGYTHTHFFSVCVCMCAMLCMRTCTLASFA